MTKRFKIWFHAGSSSDIREFSVSKPVFSFLLLLGLATAGVLGWGGYDYYQLKKQAIDNGRLRRAVALQLDEIQGQNKQIQKFASAIEELKTQVKTLSQLEERVRLIADIQKSNGSNGLIGIGGIPENSLDPELPLDARHNNLMREMNQQTRQTALAAKQQELDFNHLIKELEKKKSLLAATPSIRPVDGWITSKFGYRKSPFTGKRDFHSGLDIANRPGTKVIATADGKITYAARKIFIGKLVTIDHG